MYRCFLDKQFFLSFVFSLLLLSASLVFNYEAGLYATERASNAVTDIILSNIPVFDVDGLFIYGAIVFWAFIIGVLLYKPQTIPFILKGIALFVIIRSVFISLTHIGPFPDQIALAPGNLIDRFAFGGDLFFSGHTGLPFLLSVFFWKDKILRSIFLGASFVFAVVVLLGHLHYSIDVLAAFFITYTIAVLAKKFFAKDYERFSRALENFRKPRVYS